MKMIIRAICACASLLAGCGLCCGQDATTPIDATLCELYQNPEKYSGKMIRVRAGSVGELRIEDLLHDSQTKSCPAYMRIVVVYPDQVKPSPDFQLIRDGAYKKLQEALHYPGPIHIDATYEGRFDAAFAWRDRKRIKLGEDKKKGFGKRHEYDAQIVLHQVSDVWTLPLPRK